MAKELSNKDLQEIKEKIAEFKKSASAQQEIRSKLNETRREMVYVKKRRKIDAEVYRHAITM